MSSPRIRLLSCAALSACAMCALSAAAPAAPPKPADVAPITLALDQTPALPALPERNAASTLARTLQAELSALESRASAGDLAAQAQHAWRRMAFDMLLHGGTAQAQALAIAGFRMADARADFDRLVSRDIPDDPIGQAARIALNDAVQSCAKGLQPVPPADAPEHQLADQLALLRRAVSLLEKRHDPPVADAWPSLAEVAATIGGATEPPAPSATLVRQQVKAALDAATWLRDSDRQALQAALATPAGGGAGVQSSTAHALHAATQLLKSEQPWDAAKLRVVFAALAAQISAGRAERLASVLEAAHMVRDYDVNALALPMRGPAKEVRLQAARSAATVAGLLPQMIADDGPLTDPALISAAESQTGALRDLQRMAEAATWADRLGAVRAAAREPFDRIVKNWVQALAQPSQRVATRATMDAFAAQLAQFCPMRLEARLRARDDAAIAAAAGQSQALLAEIDRRRDLWAAAWTRGNGGTAAPAMVRASQVMEALAAVAALEGREPIERTLPRWGGFSAPSRGLGIHPAALTGRAKLAAEALLARDDQAVDSQLHALQRDLPVVWFAADASDRLAPWLAPRAGVLAQLDAVCSGPDSQSWMGAQREVLMQFSRAAREEAFLRDSGDTARAEEMREHLAALARATLPLRP